MNRSTKLKETTIAVAKLKQSQILESGGRGINMHTKQKNQNDLKKKPKNMLYLFTTYFCHHVYYKANKKTEL